MSKVHNHHADNWCRQILLEQGYVLVCDQFELVVDTPWSLVVRYQTDRGDCYLKQVPAKIAMEARIIDLVNQCCADTGPAIIAANSELHCFVMQDAGPSIREQLFNRFDVSLAIKGIEHFKNVQSCPLMWMRC